MKKPVNIGVFQIRDRRLEQFLFYHDIFFVDSHQCEDGSMIWEYEDCPYFREVLLEWKEQQLLSYGWPGNVRELQNKIKRAVLLSKQPIIETVCLNIRIEDEKEKIFLFPENETQEKQSIIRALKICTGNRKRTAEMLHIDPSTLYRKMKKYGLNDK